MGEAAKNRRIQRAGEQVADEVLAEAPPNDKVYDRDELLGRKGFTADDGSRTSQVFFDAFQHRLKDKGGRMYVVAGPKRITITAKEDTIGVSEEMSMRAADRSLERHIETVSLVSKHLDAQGRANAADSINRVSGLAAMLRREALKAGLKLAKTNEVQDA